MSVSLREAFSAAWRAAGFDADADGVVACLFESDAWAPWSAQADALLDAVELARARRMRRSGDQVARILAYALHRLVVAETTGLDPMRVPMGRDDEGRPLTGIAGLHTSLSHTEGAIAVAVSRTGPVGIDVEHEARASGIVEIADEICHDSERGLPANHPALAQRHLLELWARKEAYLKASGVGLAHPMRAFALQEGARLPLVGDQAAVVVHVQTLALSTRYVTALACPDDARIATALLRPR